MSGREERKPAPAARAPDRRAVAVGLVVVAILFVVYGVALFRDGDSPHVAASLEEMLAEPDDVVGERRVVSGEVADVLAERVLLVGGREFGLEPLPVLLTSRARDEIDGRIAPGDIVHLAGQFRRLDLAQLERQTGAELPEERFEPGEGGLLLVADRAAVDERVQRKRPGRSPTATANATLNAADA